ncbi:hypothetical protein Tco_0396693 [Tanacetum coccineum]
MPHGTTQVVTRGASNDCVSDCTGGRWRLDQSDGDTWHWRVSVRGTVAVSTSNEHLDTIPVTESANTIKSSVEDLVPTPSESADLSDGESECDVPINDDSPESHFSTFDNPLFDSNDDFSSDDESLSEEEIQKDEFKYFSNPLYDLDDGIITNEKNFS